MLKGLPSMSRIFNFVFWATKEPECVCMCVCVCDYQGRGGDMKSLYSEKLSLAKALT